MQNKNKEKMKKKNLVLSMLLVTVFTSLRAQDEETVGASPWGKEDEIGTLNMMTEQSRASALASIGSGRAYDLSVEYFVGMPSFDALGDPGYQYWLTHTPDGTVVDNPNGMGTAMNQKVSYTGDAISMYTHMGTHIDALNHFGLNGKITNDELKSSGVNICDALFRDPTSPTLGNHDAKIGIVEFFDYRCPYCKRLSNLLKQSAMQ